MSLRPSRLLIVVALGFPALVEAATSQPAFSDMFPIFASVAQHEQFQTASTFNCGFWNGASDSCDLSWTMTYKSIDPGLSNFTATWDPAGINLTGTFGYPDQTSRTWRASILNNTSTVHQQQLNRPVVFSGINGLPNTSAAGDYYSHPAQSAPTQPKSVIESVKDFLDDVGDTMFFQNEVTENPTLATFDSSVTRLAGAVYEYKYTVKNMTTTPLMFDWLDAGRSGTLDAGEILTWSLLTGDEPLVAYGRLSTVLKGGSLAGPSTTLIPDDRTSVVPLPAPVFLLASGLALVALRWRRPRPATAPPAAGA